MITVITGPIDVEPGTSRYSNFPIKAGSIFSSLLDNDVFYLFLQKQKSAQSYIPQGYFPPYEAV
jgi:hypothetical protein